MLFGFEKAEHFAISDKTFGNVPKTGLEPAHPLRYQNLNLMCLPISPPGQVFSQGFVKDPFENPSRAEGLYRLRRKERYTTKV